MEEIFKQELNDMPLDMLLGAAGAYADLYNRLLEIEDNDYNVSGFIDYKEEVKDKMIKLTEAVNKRFQDMEELKNV